MLPLTPLRADKIRKLWRAQTLSLVCTVLAAYGCASMDRSKSGYLKSYPAGDDLKPGSGILRRSASATDMAQIDSFHIQEVVWRSKRPTEIARHPEKAGPILAQFRQALEKELSKLKPVVDQPGARSAVVYAAITDMVESIPALNVVTTLLISPVTNGGASIEAEVVAPDGKVIAQVILSRSGSPLEVGGFYTSQGHARSACRKGAELIREALSPSPNTIY